MAQQLVIDLFPEASYAPESFVVGPNNRVAHEALSGPESWPGPLAVLHGPPRSGKTHLARLWAARAGAPLFEAATLDGDPGVDALVIEDADGAKDQTVLFHLHNRLARDGGRLLLTSRQPPAGWPVTLPDLKSRIGAALTLELGEPDDEMLGRLIAKLAEDRGLTVPADVSRYMTVRLQRSFAVAEDTVRVLDQLSLRKKRRVTKPLVREILAELDEGRS